MKNKGNKALNTRPLITQIRGASNFVRFTASMVLITFAMLVATPTVAAVRAVSGQNTKVAMNEPSAEVKFAELVQQIEDQLVSWEQKVATGQSGFAETEQLNGLKARLDVLAKIILDKFAQQRQQIIDKGLDEVILKRHDEFVAKYQSNLDQLKQYLDTVLGGPNDATLKKTLRDATAWLKSQQKKRSQQPFDPNNLPNKNRKADPDKKPRLKKEEFHQSGLFDTPLPKLAALGDFTFDNLFGANDPAYLAETDEVNLNPFIQDKAAELNHDPVKIYHWVRNNVEWLPSWGAVQDAELTLSAKRGNAFDIASLTIALLRASGIPSRYVHGTIDVPLEEFKNWAGGFDTAEAAATYAASGGIPLTLFTSVGPEGEIQTIRMEHVWVEAAIDYVPSRGASNFDADEWVELDPSYKQYVYSGGLDAVQISGVDPNQVAQTIGNSGAVNEQESWVANLDPALLTNPVNLAQQNLETYVDENLIDPIVGDVVGGGKKIVREYPVLPGSLPNPIVVEGARYDKVTTQLQQKVSFSLETDIFGSPLNPVTFPWSKLNNERVTLSFRPATDADEQALNALIPNEVTDPNQLPQSISSNLVQLVPELKVNGVVVKSGSPMKPGEELSFSTGISFVGSGGSSPPRVSNVIAGSFLSVNVFAGSVSPAKMDSARSRLEQTKTTLETGDEALIGGLTREDVLGDIFYLGSLSYYSQLIAFGHVQGVEAGAYQYLAAGYGTVGYEPNVVYFFGFPQAIETGGVAFDIPMITVTAAKNGDAEKRSQFAVQLGIVGSALEHMVPEQMFGTQTDPVDAVSTVKAFVKANAAGQRIYRITDQNKNLVLPNIHHDQDAMSEIQSALASGKEVTTHTDPISVPGWTGSGYMIIDPQTGEGAYKISGGQNGGFVELINEYSGYLTIGAVVLSLISLAGGWIGLIAGVLAFVLAVSLAVAAYIAFEAEMQGDCKKFAALFGLLQVLSVLVGVMAGGFVGGIIMSALASYYFLTAVEGIGRAANNLFCK